MKPENIRAFGTLLVGLGAGLIVPRQAELAAVRIRDCSIVVDNSVGQGPHFEVSAGAALTFERCQIKGYPTGITLDNPEAP